MACGLASRQTFALSRLAVLLAINLHPLHGELRTLPPDPADGITQEMMDQEEFNRKQGFAMGVTGEFFRYKHLFYKQPTEKDRDEAISVGAKIRCDVCVATIDSLLSKAGSLDEDGIADVLEGNAEYEPTGDFVTDRMLSHKKGCNKHFKDEIIAQGWVLRTCKEVYPERNDSEPCLYLGSAKPNQQAMDSYEMWKECIFHACEQTVSRFSDSLAEYLADALPGSANRTAVVSAACEKQARCARVERPSGGSPAGKASVEKRGKNKKEKKNKKKTGGKAKSKSESEL